MKGNLFFCITIPIFQGTHMHFVIFVKHTFKFFVVSAIFFFLLCKLFLAVYFVKSQKYDIKDKTISLLINLTQSLTTFNSFAVSKIRNFQFSNFYMTLVESQSRKRYKLNPSSLVPLESAFQGPNFPGWKIWKSRLILTQN